MTSSASPLRILPVGDSITRGSYLAKYAEGPYLGEACGLPHPANGGWRKRLQELLREAGTACTFVGELDYHAYGRDGVVDASFQPRHHGLAGFGNAGILHGGIVPTPRDVLDALGLRELRVPAIAEVLQRHQPNVVLLMSGSNGFDAPARECLVGAILEHLRGHLLVATIPPQKPPRPGWEGVAAYNALLPASVTRWQAAGHAVRLVDVHAAVSPEMLLEDGVHPDRAGMDAIANAWYAALLAAHLLPEAAR